MIDLIDPCTILSMRYHLVSDATWLNLIDVLKYSYFLLIHDLFHKKLWDNPLVEYRILK